MGTSLLAITTPLMALVLLFYAYLIIFKKNFNFIPSYKVNSEQEKQTLQQNKYPQAFAVIYILFAVLLGMETTFNILNIPNHLAIFSFLMLCCLPLSLFYIISFDLKELRRKKYISLLKVCGLTLLLLASAFSAMAFTQNTLTIVDNSRIIITDQYGITRGLGTIQSVTLTDTLPVITNRIDGFTFLGHKKGIFKLQTDKKGLVYVYANSPPFIVIEKESETIIINSSNSTETNEWYKKLSHSWNNVKKIGTPPNQ